MRLYYYYLIYYITIILFVNIAYLKIMHLIDADFNLKCTVGPLLLLYPLITVFLLDEEAQHNISSSLLLGNYVFLTRFTISILISSDCRRNWNKQ